MGRYPRAQPKGGIVASNIGARKTHATLDGEAAAIHFPLEGKAEVITHDGKRRACFDREQAQKIMRSGGEFQSPAFARPRAQR